MSAVGKHGIPWSAADVAQLELMMSQRIDRKEIAAQLGRTERAVDAKVSLLQRRNSTQKYRDRQQRRYNGASFFLS